MPNFIIIEQSQFLRMPWKNGLGETLEIQRHEDKIGLRFRISQASVVENGMFSDFSGLHRTLVLLSGEGMTLEHTDSSSKSSHILNKLLDIARFSGGDETYATLKSGKIEDLNIMVRDTDTQAKVEAYSAPCSLLLSNNDTSISTSDTLFSGFYAAEDTVMDIESATPLLIKAHSMVIFSEETNATLAQGNGILIKVTAI
jgi:environmental stress-induced protein Ves